MSSRRLSLALLITAIAFITIGCNRNTVFFHYEHTSIAGWEKSDTLRMNIPPISAEGNYEERLGLRINGQYPFQSICLIVEQTVFPAGLFHKDTLNIRLTDQAGNMRGKGINYFQYDVTFRQLRLQQNDSLHIAIRHNMKREILPGIADIGIALQRQ